MLGGTYCVRNELAFELALSIKLRNIIGPIATTTEFFHEHLSEFEDLVHRVYAATRGDPEPLQEFAKVCSEIAAPSNPIPNAILLAHRDGCTTRSKASSWLTKRGMPVDDATLQKWEKLLGIKFDKEKPGPKRGSKQVNRTRR